MEKVKRFIRLDSGLKKLLIEAFLFLGWARIIKARPFSKTISLLGTPMEETPVNSNSSQTVQLISECIHIMSRYTFWESQCLVKAIAAMKMLERRNIASTLYLGTGKDGEGKLIAHAWLRCGNKYVTGEEGRERFTAISSFAKKIESGDEFVGRKRV